MIMENLHEKVNKTESLRNRILQSAMKEFFTHGYIRTTTRKIAQNAGTSESGIFRIFSEGKYELLMAVYNYCWGEVNDEIDKVLSQCKFRDPRQKLLKLIHVVWRLYRTKPRLIAFIIINTGNTDTLLIERKSHAEITIENSCYAERIEAICKEIVSAAKSPMALTSRALTEAVLGIMEGILLGWYLHDKTPKGMYPKKISEAEGFMIFRKLLDLENR